MAVLKFRMGASAVARIKCLVDEEGTHDDESTRAASSILSARETKRGFSVSISLSDADGMIEFLRGEESAAFDDLENMKGEAEFCRIVRSELRSIQSAISQIHRKIYN